MPMNKAKANGIKRPESAFDKYNQYDCSKNHQNILDGFLSEILFLQT